MANATIRDLHPFAGPEHRSFKLDGGRQAALMLHGFMGTPAEMRPLAGHLNQAGWTVEGLLLPGFGNQLDTLFERSYRDWVDAAASALSRLQERHQPVVLIGYSLGGAIALNVAAEQPPDALVLLAPFWRLGNTLHYVIWQIVRRFFPNPRPFRKANFSEDRLSEFIGGIVPDLDLSDPQVQDTLKELRVPSRFGQQIVITGRSAGKAATRFDRPTLIVQGVQDEVSKPGNSRRLLNRLPGAVKYEELEADHSLVKAENPGFTRMSRSVLAFADAMVTANPLDRSQE